MEPKSVILCDILEEPRDIYIEKRSHENHGIRGIFAQRFQLRRALVTLQFDRFRLIVSGNEDEGPLCEELPKVFGDVRNRLARGLGFQAECGRHFSDVLSITFN